MTILLNAQQYNMLMILLRSIGPKPSVERLSEVVVKLSEQLNTMKWLELASQKLTHREISILFRALETNHSLITVNLSHNRIGAGEIQVGHEPTKMSYMQSLATFIAGHPCLVKLDLSSNEMNDHDIQEFIQSLSSNFGLETLNLKSNWIRSEGFSAIFNTIANAHHRIFSNTFLGQLLEFEPTSVRNHLQLAYRKNRVKVDTRCAREAEERVRTAAIVAHPLVIQTQRIGEPASQESTALTPFPKHSESVTL